MIKLNNIVLQCCTFPANHKGFAMQSEIYIALLLSYFHSQILPSVEKFNFSLI